MEGQMEGLSPGSLGLPQVQQSILLRFVFLQSPLRFVCSKRALAEGATECLPALVLREKCDLLSLAVAPSVRGPPVEVLDVLRTAKTSVLIWQPKQAQQAY